MCHWAISTLTRFPKTVLLRRLLPACPWRRIPGSHTETSHCRNLQTLLFLWDNLGPRSQVSAPSFAYAKTTTHISFLPEFHLLVTVLLAPCKQFSKRSLKISVLSLMKTQNGVWEFPSVEAKTRHAAEYPVGCCSLFFHEPEHRAACRCSSRSRQHRIPERGYANCLREWSSGPASCTAENMWALNTPCFAGVTQLGRTNLQEAI